MRAILAHLLATALRVASASSNSTCATGVTLSGLSADLDSDYLGTSFSAEGADIFQAEDNRHLYLSRGCRICKETMMDSWVIWTEESGDYIVRARCADGCPDAGRFWPTGPRAASTWHLVKDGADVPGDSRAGVSAACCKRKPQPCDSCSRDHCNTHTSFAGCLAASLTTDRCCDGSLWLYHKECACKPEPTLCDHSAGSAEALAPTSAGVANLVV